MRYFSMCAVQSILLIVIINRCFHKICTESPCKGRNDGDMVDVFMYKYQKRQQIFWVVVNDVQSTLCTHGCGNDRS